MKHKIVLASMLILAFTAGVLSTWIFSFPGSEPEETPQEEPDVVMPQARRPAPEGAVKTYLVAVTEGGRGVVAPMWVKSEPGNGKILVDIESLFFWVDTQYSMRLSSMVAKDYLNITEEENNLVYSINTNASIVGGPSAGGPLTVATIAALRNRSLRQDVIMTGSVQPDGSIGDVGGILEKAKAAESAGFKTFLIPEGQLVQTNYVRTRECSRMGGFEICRTNYEPRRFNVTDEVDMKVQEVSDIGQAVEYFIAS